MSQKKYIFGKGNFIQHKFLIFLMSVVQHFHTHNYLYLLYYFFNFWITMFRVLPPIQCQTPSTTMSESVRKRGQQNWEQLHFDRRTTYLDLPHFKAANLLMWIVWLIGLNPRDFGGRHNWFNRASGMIWNDGYLNLNKTN